MGKKRVALVLAGGAARGAYEVGVIAVRPRRGRARRSVATSASTSSAAPRSVRSTRASLAAHADLAPRRVGRVLDAWRAPTRARSCAPDVTGVLSWARASSAARGRPTEPPAREGGLLDPRGIERSSERPSLSIASARTSRPAASTRSRCRRRTSSAARRSSSSSAASRRPPRWSRDPTIEPRAPQHPRRSTRSRRRRSRSSSARCSIDGEFHCDGGLRQNVPLSPARRLGADGADRHQPALRRRRPRSASADPAIEDLFPGPLFLLGKTLNALLLDRIDTDLARLQSINRILDAGTRRYGAGLPRGPQRVLGSRAGARACGRCGRARSRVARHRQARRRVRPLAGVHRRERLDRPPHPPPRRARLAERGRPALVPALRRRVRRASSSTSAARTPGRATTSSARSSRRWRSDSIRSGFAPRASIRADRGAPEKGAGAGETSGYAACFDDPT